MSVCCSPPGSLTSLGQWLLRRLASGNGIDVTTAIWFEAGRMPALRTLGSAALSIVIVGMGAPLGREGAPKQFGAVFGNLFSSLQKLSDDERRLVVAIGAGAGMAAVYSVPLGGAIFALEVLRGALALRLVLPALAAALIAAKTASFVVPNAPIYAVPAYAIPPEVYLWAVDRLAVHRLVVGRASCAGRLGRSRPALGLAPLHRPAARVRRHWARFNRLSRDARQRPGSRPAPVSASARRRLRLRLSCCSGRSRPWPRVASGAPGGLFTPSLAAGALMGAALGGLWLCGSSGGEIGLYALLGAGAMLAATTQGPISSLVLMMELTGQARAFALPMLTAIVIATATARLIEWRSIYEARLSDEAGGRALAGRASASGRP